MIMTSIHMKYCAQVVSDYKKRFYMTKENGDEVPW